MTDEQLAHLAQQGDLDALEALARHNRTTMRRWALYATGDVASAEDVTQEALVRLIRFVGRYDPARPFHPWLRSLVRSAAADHRRTASRFGRQAPTPPLPREMDRALDLERAAQRAHEAFSALTPRQREAMILCDRQGLTAAEAGSRMGVEASTVRALIYQARRAVRTRLLAAGPDLLELVRDA